MPKTKPVKPVSQIFNSELYGYMQEVENLLQTKIDLMIDLSGGESGRNFCKSEKEVFDNLLKLRSDVYSKTIEFSKKYM